MSRSQNDPRVMEILGAFDRQAASSVAVAHTLDGFMACVAGVAFERFLIPCPWPSDAIRAVLLAIVLHAPDRDLDQMLTEARTEAGYPVDWEVSSSMPAVH